MTRDDIAAAAAAHRELGHDYDGAVRRGRFMTDPRGTRESESTTNHANGTKERPMRLLWQPREYERTCADCGYTWRVPRKFAHRRVQSVSMFARPMYRGGLDPKSLEHSELDGEITASMEISKEAEAFKTCPKCGSERYAQQGLRRRGA